MTDNQGFLQAIIADPEDDAPRLVYADWLDEHGDTARAEFIRTQCERARLPRNDERSWPLEQREQALLKEHEQAWAAPLPGLAEFWQFRRGFVEWMQIEGEKFLPCAEELFAAFPLRSLQLIIVGWQHRRYMEQFAALPQLARLHTLDLEDCCFTVPSLHRLLASPHLSGLRILELRGNDFSSGILPALARAPALAGLTTLSLGGDSFTSRAFGTGSIRQVAKGPWPARLTRLHLGYVSGGLPSVRALVASPYLAQLRRLSLSIWKMLDAGARELAGCERLVGLTFLSLHSNHISDAGAQALLDSPHLRGLKFLHLSGNRISEPMEQALEARFGTDAAAWADPENAP
jgi:uncharacterized protein (TIGR02996 family)